MRLVRFGGPIINVDRVTVVHRIRQGEAWLTELEFGDNGENNSIRLRDEEGNAAWCFFCSNSQYVAPTSSLGPEV